ncbi:MAG: hypothetical protein ABI175_00580, partial [Polyangiales bacterium]
MIPRTSSERDSLSRKLGGHIMSFFQRSFLIRSSALIALTLGSTSTALIGCGGGDDEILPTEDVGGDDSGDASVIDSAKTDSGTDTSDAAKPDGATDTADAAKTDATDAADVRTDADTAVPDTREAGADADTAVPADTSDTAVPADTSDTAVAIDTLDSAPADTA